jgi:hypothetical protein
METQKKTDICAIWKYFYNEEFCNNPRGVLTRLWMTGESTFDFWQAKFLQTGYSVTQSPALLLLGGSSPK